MLTPAIILNSSPDRWPAVPLPPDAMLTLPGLALGISDELGNCLRRERWVYRHNEGDRDDAGDRCDVAEEVEIEFFVKRRIDRGRRADQEQGVSVRRRIHDHLRTNIAAGSRPVLDDKLLAETLR